MMFEKILSLWVLMVTCLSVQAGEDLPVLRANSATVDVQDGERFWKGIWNVDPAVDLDIYDAQRSIKPKKVTFITDVESLTIDVTPGHTYDFVILLGGEQRCRTRISTMRQSCSRVGRGSTDGMSVVPLTINNGKLHLSAQVNDSGPLDLIFDTGADHCVLYPSASSKHARLCFDGVIDNAGTGGVTRRQTSSDNRLDIAGLHWEHEPFISVERQVDTADGIVGYTVFEDKVIELDYDRMIMIVHDVLPEYATSFSRTALSFSGSLTAVDVSLYSAGTVASGSFVLDSAGTGTMIVNQSFAMAGRLHENFQKIGTSKSSGVGSAVIWNDVLLVPRLTIAGFTLSNLPIDVQKGPIDNQAPAGGMLCMDLLQRFNTILDYPNNEAYFKPNSNFNAPFKSRSSGPTTFAIAAAIVAVAVILAAILRHAWLRSSTVKRISPIV